MPFSFFIMLETANPHLLALLGGTLLGLAIVLATDQIQAYGWAALSAYIGVQCTLPLVRHIAKEEKGGQQ